MTKRTVLATAAVAAALAAGLGTIARSDDDDHDHGRGPRRLWADLRGFNEAPGVSTAARGSFRAVLSADETSIEYRLRFWGLEGTITQSHIHFGDHHTSGGVSVWLCGTSTNPGPPSPVPAPPACSAGDPASGDVTGKLEAANVVGPAVQGIGAGEFAELVRAIKGGMTYVNVHSTKFPGGEIRGEIRAR